MNKRLNKMVVVLLIIVTALLTEITTQADDTVETERMLTVEYTMPVAYKGAIITGIRDDEVTYADKCENCGDYNDGHKFRTSDVGVIKDTFKCSKCKRRQDVYIVVKGFSKNLWVTEEIIMGAPEGEDEMEAEMEDENELYKDENAQVIR